MRSHHILTVGISLITNFARAANVSPDEAMKKHADLRRFLEADPVKACAEINSLQSRTGFMDREKKEIEVTLAFTSTLEGKSAASLIERELKKRGVPVHRIPVRGLDAPARDLSPDFAAREAAASLEDFRQRIVSHVAKLKQRNPDVAIQFNCTGGYKAECAVLYELGRTLRVPVYYLHEKFKVAIELP